MNKYPLGLAPKKILSLFIIANLVFAVFVSLGLWSVSNVSAYTVDHTVGNLDISGLTDYGRVGDRPFLWNGVRQTAGWSKVDSYNGLVFDHSLYDHSGGEYNIADWWDTMEMPIFPEFNVTGSDDSIYFEEDTPDLQKSTATFTQVDAYNTIGISYDVRIHQTAWTLVGKDWAIIEWRVENLRTSSLTSVNIGMEVFSSWTTTSNWYGVDGDSGDDLDLWDAATDTYYLQDDTLVSIGYSSADTSNPLDHYYGDIVNFFDDDKDAHSALTGGDQLASSFFTPGSDPIYSLVSWNNRVIPQDEEETFALVIACGVDDTSMFNAITEAQTFWESTRLKITEIGDSPNTNEQVEIFNGGVSSIDLTGYYLTPDYGVTKWFLDALGTISSMGHEVLPINPSVDNLGDEGGEIALFDSNDFILDRVGYGTLGTAPDPLSSESTSRYFTGTRYNEVWSRETTPTFGAQNTVADANSNPKVVLNEVLFNPATREAFIELKYVGMGVSVPILGWKIVVDTEYTIGDYTLSPSYRYFVINEAKASGLFSSMTNTGDNVYLYNDTGALMDMVGWNLPHVPDLSLARVPEGFGTYDGYDDTSSIAAGWQFDLEPTMALVNIEADSEDSADLGDTMSFYLNVTNAGDTLDVIDLNYTSFVDGLPGWWVIDLSYGDGSWTPITDTDGDGLLDVGAVAPQDYVTIIVNVTVPATLPIGGTNIITMGVWSSENPWAYDTAILTAGSYPHIEAYKSVSPNSIYVEGGGAFGFVPDSATLTINLTGKGWIPGTQISQDVIFCMDRSSSMLSSDPARERVAGAQYYTNLLNFPARAGVVEFNETSQLILELTDDYDFVKAMLATIGADGLTDMSQGLITSINELIDNGNYYHNRVIILLTDGQNNYPWQDDATLDQAQRAKDNGIIIFTIGLGDQADETLLQQITTITGGKYYFSPTPDNLQAIFGYIAEELIVIAGHDPDPDDPDPLLTDVLPPYIDYLPGSFIDPNTGDPMDPTNIIIDGNGNTILEWNISQIAIGQIWEVSFTITCDEVGLKETNVYGISSVNYTRYLDANTTMITNDTLPRVWLNVLPIPPLPPILYCNLTDNKQDVWLNWTQPPTPTDHYLIYRSETKQGFDFSIPWKDTSFDVNPISGMIDPLNRNWLDVDSALPSAPSQYYYIVRSVEASGNISVTSNTVGKWTRAFGTGVDAFSLPLEPFETKSADWYCDDIPNVEYIKWTNSTTQTWTTHLKSDPLGVNDANIVIDEGYEIKVTAQTYYTFCGRPGTSIRYDEENLGAPSGFTLNLGPMVDVPQVSEFGLDLYSTTDIGLGDFNKDGNLDVVESNMNWFNSIYLGDGKGNFGMPGSFGGFMDMTMCIAVGDVNNDTNLDAVVGNIFQTGFVYLGNGDGTFGTTYPYGNATDVTVSLALGDIDKDGNLDIVRGDNMGVNEVFLRDGDGTFDTYSFTYGSGSDATLSVLLGDVNKDGSLDIAAGNYQEQNAVYLGDGTGNFPTPINFGTGFDDTGSLALGDIGDDGFLDIVVGNIESQNVIYFGDGDGTFDTRSLSFGDADDLTYKVVLGDLNEDLNLDIVLGNDFDGSEGKNYVFLGDGDGDINSSYEYGSGIDPTRGVALGDLNNDNRLDIITGNYGYYNYAYYWLKSYSVDLSWNPVSDLALDRYLIYRAETRDGLNLLSLQVLDSTTGSIYSDVVEIYDGVQYYYCVAAVVAGDIIAYNTTYSLGMYFSEYDEGYGSFGLPLEPFIAGTVDSLCNEITNTTGINYYIRNEQRWGWHSERMPAGAYDPTLGMSEGYQLSTSDETEHVFIGI
jgi:uncharacterized protein YegL